MKWTNMLIAFLIYFSSSISAVHAKIRIGTVSFDPPYVFSLDQGFEIELIKLLCHRLNEECEISSMSYFSLFTNLKNGKIDLAIDSIPFYITQNSSNEDYIYSYPYLLNEGQFLTLKSNNINLVKDLPKGSRIGLVRESNIPNQGVFYDFFISKYDSNFQIILFDDMESLIAALSNGKITAAFLDKNEANYWELNGGDQFNALEKSVKVADGIGIMALPKNSLLINQLNQELKKIETQNEYINLYNTYLGSAIHN